jgi:hypothetical protein
MPVFDHHVKTALGAKFEAPLEYQLMLIGSSSGCRLHSPAVLINANNMITD